MYCKFYGLKERPFNVTADPNFFFASKIHREALSHLIYGGTERKGVIVLTGEIGTGKTTLCRFFLNRLGENTRTAFILNPYFSETELLEAIVRDFGIEPSGGGRLSLVFELNKFLLRESEKGNNIILIIDEAQNLKAHMLEQVRLLSNLETEKQKLLQLVLVGQPELNRVLSLYELRQLRQRITVRYHISPLQHDEIKEYINHRLNIAGSNNRIEFTDDAIGCICDFSAGVPRLINIVCDRALLAGFVEEVFKINFNIVKKCLEELNSYFVGESVK